MRLLSPTLFLASLVYFLLSLTIGNDVIPLPRHLQIAMTFDELTNHIMMKNKKKLTLSSVADFGRNDRATPSVRGVARMGRMKVGGAVEMVVVVAGTAFERFDRSTTGGAEYFWKKKFQAIGGKKKRLVLEKFRNFMSSLA